MGDGFILLGFKLGGGVRGVYHYLPSQRRKGRTPYVILEAQPCMLPRTPWRGRGGRANSAMEGNITVLDGDAKWNKDHSGILRKLSELAPFG